MAKKKSPTQAGDQSRAGFEDTAENYRIIAQTASDAIITINEDSTILFVNEAAVKIFGYSSEEMLGSDLTMLMPEYLRHLHKAGLQSYLDTGSKHISWSAVELPGLHKSGREIPLELSFGEFHSQGQRFFTGIARDITRRKRDESRLALQHSLAQILSEATTLEEAGSRLLESICNNLGWQFSALWTVQRDKLRLVTYWRQPSSKGATEFESASILPEYDPSLGFPGQVMAERKPLWVVDFGLAAFPRSPVAARGNLHSAFGFPIILGDEVLGVIELFSDETKEAEEEMLNTLVAIGNQVGQFIERKNNEQELIAALARERDARLEAEGLSTQLSALQRITNAALGHLTVDLVLSESLDRIREVMNVDTVAILLLEAEGNELVAWAAKGLEEEVEQGVRIPVGKGFAGRVVAEKRPVIIEDIRKAHVLNPLLAQKGIKSLLGVPLLVEGRATGVLHVGKLKLTTFTDQDVKLLELAADRIALAVENARLYQIEQTARAEAEGANRAKDEFLTILSHELRTPLTPIIGWVHMMETGILKDSEFHRVLSIVNRNAYSLKRLINDLLDMSAILSGKMRIDEAPVLVGSLLEECVETMRTFATESKVQLHLKVLAEPDEQMVIGDRSRLHQSFCNILHNAIKFSPANSTVRVTCEASDSEVIVSFEDEGAGIPEEFLPHVFDRFRQADASRKRAYGGLGLGLSLVQSFVEGHHGVVEANSAGEDKGSTFVIKLPRAATGGKATDRSADIRSGEAKALTCVLIVEDQPDTLEMLRLSLEQRGFEVLACASAHEALQMLEKNRVDILVSDVAMPVMDGLQLIKKLREREDFKNTPAIALTGYASNKDVNSALAAGFDLHLPKPIDPTDLVNEIQGLLKATSVRTFGE
ncbi:MAG TPA: GAF domain-containing protein [Pyrinomonadaceae bacterium]|nr:GAF domain-containing protein [Pyrinomonadaceae bacterium]